MATVSVLVWFPTTSSTRTTAFPVWNLQAVVVQLLVQLLHPWMSRIFSAHTSKRLGEGVRIFNGESGSLFLTNTLPETNMAPEKWWFPIGISFSRGLFSGATLVSVSVPILS